MSEPGVVLPSNTLWPPYHRISVTPRGRDQFDGRRQGRHIAGVAHVGLEVRHVFMVEAQDFIGFAHEGLDDAGRRNRFLQDRRDVCRRFLNLPAGAADFAAEEVHEPQYHGERAEREDRQTPVQVDHGADGTDEDETFCHQLDRVLDKGALQSVDVVRNVAHDGARLVLVVERHGQALQLAEHLGADIDDDMLPHVTHEIVLTEEEDAAENEDDHDADGNHVQHEGILFGQHLIHHVADDPGQVQVARRCEDRADERCHQHFRIGLDVG